MPPISTLTVQLELNNQKFNDGLKQSEQAAEKFEKSTRQAAAAQGLMEQGFKSDSANKIAANWENAAKKAEVFGQVYKKGTESAVQSTGNATAAVQLLSREIGVSLPEGVTRFIASSQKIAPALNAAFSGLAVVGLIQTLLQLPPIFERLVESVTGWGAAAKRAMDEAARATDLARERTDALALAQQKVLEMGLTGVPLAEAQLRFLDQQLGKVEEDLRKAEEKKNNLLREYRELDVIGERPRLIRHPTEVEQQKAGELGPKIEEFKRQQIMLEAEQTVARERLRLARRADADAVKPVKTIQATTHALEEQTKAIITAAEAWDIAKHRMDSAGAIARELTTTTLPNLGLALEEAMPADFFGPALQLERTMEAMREGRRRLEAENLENYLNQQGRDEAAAEAMKKRLDDQQQAYMELFRNIRDAAGHVWDDMFTRGESVFKSLENMLKGFANTLGRTLFQDLASGILAGGKPGGGLLGMGAQAGAGGLLGGLFGGGAATSLGSTVAAGTAGSIASASFPGLAIAAPGGAAAGTAGAAGAGGFGALGALFTNPWTAVAAGAGIGLWALLRNRTQEAPFTADPFANRAGQERTFMFNTNPFGASILEGPQSLTGTLDRLNRNLERIEGVPSDAFLKTKMRTFYDTDNTFRRTSGSKLMGDEL